MLLLIHVMDKQKRGLRVAENLFGAWAIYSLWYVKIEQSQNQYLSTSLERPYTKSYQMH